MDLNGHLWPTPWPDAPAAPRDFTASRPESPNWDAKPCCASYQVQHRGSWQESPVSAELHLCESRQCCVSAVTAATRAGVVTVPQERPPVGQPGAGKPLQPSSSLGSGGASTSYNEGKLSQALDWSLPDTGAFELWVKNKAPC